MTANDAVTDIDIYLPLKLHTNTRTSALVKIKS
jgi:hypothetical protein